MLYGLIGWLTYVYVQQSFARFAMMMRHSLLRCVEGGEPNPTWETGYCLLDIAIWVGNSVSDSNARPLR